MEDDGENKRKETTEKEGKARRRRREKEKRTWSRRWRRGELLAWSVRTVQTKSVLLLPIPAGPRRWR